MSVVTILSAPAVAVRRPASLEAVGRRVPTAQNQDRADRDTQRCSHRPRVERDEPVAASWIYVLRVVSDLNPRLTPSVGVVVGV